MDEYYAKRRFDICFGHKTTNPCPFEDSLQCRRILGGRNLVLVRVVAAIFDFMTVEDWGE